LKKEKDHLGRAWEKKSKGQKKKKAEVSKERLRGKKRNYNRGGWSPGPKPQWSASGGVGKWAIPSETFMNGEGG